MFRKILTVVIAALGLAVAAAGPASASDSASTSDSCGAVYFYSDGDTFKFLDTCSDGHGVLLYWTTPTTGQPHTSDTGHSKAYTGGYTGWNMDNAYIYDKDFTEGACFYYRVGLTESGGYIIGSYGSWTLSCA
ncbi:hypothetical protein [Streptomyces echinatus]|uniref:hypothetical protein n=1 Tax=Streptomyces echinatus TaxID=67293 RepID=UPI00380DDDC0